MNTPSHLKYTESHEWVSVDADGTFTVGITDHAQELLGDVVFVGLPDIGKALDKGADAVVVESVKAAADVYSPVAGVVTAVNTAASDTPESLNSAPYDTWLFKLKPNDAGDAAGLMDAAAYAKHAANS